MLGIRGLVTNSAAATIALLAMAQTACSATLVNQAAELTARPPKVVSSLPDTSTTPSVGVLETACSGVAVATVQELESGIDSEPDGTEFCLAEGVYNLKRPLVPDDGHRLIGGPGVVLDGSKVISGWEPRGSVWVAPTGGVRPTRTDWSGETLNHPQSVYQQDLFLSDTPGLEKVGVRNRGEIRGDTAGSVGPGEYFIDYDADLITLGSDPAGQEASLSRTRAAIDSTADNVRIEALRIQRFAGPGIESEGGTGWKILHNEIRQNHTRGLKVYGNARVIGNDIHHNGQYGLTGTGDRNVFAENEVAYNNTARFGRSSTSFWDAGGTKFVRNTHLILRDNYVHDNFGDGLWVDIDNGGVTIAGNRIEHNYRMGINYEISFSALIQNNSVTDNGDVGIWVNSSRGVRVTGNLVKNNGDAIIIADQDREGYAVRNINVDNNEIVTSGITGTDDTRVPSFVANVYRVFDLNKKLWMWNDVEVDAAGWKGLGQDLTGRFISL